MHSGASLMILRCTRYSRMRTRCATCSYRGQTLEILTGDNDDEQLDHDDDDDLRFGLRVVGVDGGNACARVLWLLPGLMLGKGSFRHHIC